MSEPVEINNGLMGQSSACRARCTNVGGFMTPITFSVLRLSYHFDQAFLATLNDIIDPLFLLTTLPTFSGHDAQHDVLL